MSKASWLAAIFILTATPSFADRYISGNDLYPLCSATPENVPGDQQANASTQWGFCRGYIAVSLTSWKTEKWLGTGPVYRRPLQRSANLLRL